MVGGRGLKKGKIEKLELLLYERLLAVCGADIICTCQKVLLSYVTYISQTLSLPKYIYVYTVFLDVNIGNMLSLGWKCYKMVMVMEEL